MDYRTILNIIGVIVMAVVADAVARVFTRRPGMKGLNKPKGK